MRAILRDLGHRQPTFKRALRFALTGLFVTAFHVIIAVCAIQFLRTNPPTANGIAFVSATLVSYVINSVWSFSRPLHGKTLARFITVSVAGLIVAVTVASIAESFGWHYLLGILSVAIVIPPMTFLLHNFWTYK